MGLLNKIRTLFVVPEGGDPQESIEVTRYRVAMEIGEEIECAARNGNHCTYMEKQQEYKMLTGGYYGS
jgi:hypothetical protein